MSDSMIPPQLPPTPPVPATPAPVRNAPVISAPPAATPSDGETVTLAARVVRETPPVAGQVRLRTDHGDVVVKTDAPLPPDIEVSVDIQRQRAALAATVRVNNAKSEMAPPTPQTSAPAPQAPPPAPVYAGDRLMAIVLSGSVETPVPAPIPLPAGAELDALAQKIQQLAQQLLKTGGSAASGVPAPLLSGLAASKNPAAFISALAPEQQQKMLALLPASERPAPLLQTPMAPPAPPAENLADTGLLAVMKAMTSARLTQQAMQGTPATPAAQPATGGNLLGLLQNLLPVIQGVDTEGMARIATPAMTATTAPPVAGAELRIVTISPAGSATPQPAQGLMTGQVIGLTKDGMPVIKSPVADFVLNTRVNLPVGTQITFEALPLTLADMAARMGGATEDGFSFSPLTSRGWPALDDALNILAQQAPAAAQALQNTLPAPGPKMVPSTLFFLAALRLGMVENWLGAQTMQTLRESGGSRSADRIGQDFSRIAQQSTEPLQGEWRGISIPLLHNAQLDQIRFFIRRQREEDGGQKAGETTRFLVNLNLSRLGDMQLDGLMRQTQKQGSVEKRLDMVIRTDARLSSGLMHDLQDGFARGLREAHLAGRLEFQAQRQGWVQVDTATHATQTV